MATIAIIGDGPAGLSAALFLAKNAQDVTVFGKDETAMHYALLHNYLGIDEIGGTDFQQRARAQVERFGAVLRDERVTGIVRRGESFTLTTETEQEATADYVVLAAAKKGMELAEQLGVSRDGAGVDVGAHYLAADRVYVIGRMARPHRSQAIISAGAGAVAALDILARESGKDVTDWQSPEED